MKKTILEYRGKQDKEKLIEFFKQINHEVKKTEMPTNLYTFTHSPIDIVIIDFHHFNQEDIKSHATDISIVTINDIRGKVINHLIVNPYSLLLIDYNVELTASSNPYKYLALSLKVEEL